MAYLSKISGKFMLNVQNISFSWGGWLGSQVWANCFFYCFLNDNTVGGSFLGITPPETLPEGMVNGGWSLNGP